MTFNIPKDILAPPPADPQSRGVFESGGRRSSDNPEANNVGDPPRKAVSDPLDLQSTSDVVDKGEDLQMCDQNRRRQPESVKSDFARRWTKTSRIILSSYLMGYIFNITDHHLIYLIIIGMTLRCTTRILRGVRKRSPDLKKVLIVLITIAFLLKIIFFYYNHQSI